MYRPLKKLADWEHAAIVNFVGREFVHKSDLAADALAQARRLVRTRTAGSTVDSLLGRARELIDDIDTMLRALDPQRNRYQFATTGTLHLELERLEAARRDLLRERAARAGATGRG
jgi:hypothetical protein